jgi:hypothetical protein
MSCEANRELGYLTEEEVEGRLRPEMTTLEAK